MEKQDDKMADDSVIVFNFYAKYFDITSDDCATDQTWAWPVGRELPFTKERRERFNNLVTKTNAALEKGVETTSVSKMTLTFANWDSWSLTSKFGEN